MKHLYLRRVHKKIALNCLTISETSTVYAYLFYTHFGRRTRRRNGVSRVFKWRAYLLRAVSVHDSFNIGHILPARRSFEVETDEWSVQNSGSFPGVESPGPSSWRHEDHGGPLITELMHFYAWSSPISKCEICLPPLFLSSLREISPNKCRRSH